MNAPEPLFISTFQRNNAPSIKLQATLIGRNNKAAARALLDSGATGNILNQTMVYKYRIKQTPLKMARPIINADGSAGTVRAYTNLDLELQDTTGHTHRETIKFYIAIALHLKIHILRDS